MKRLYLLNSLIMPFKDDVGVPVVFAASRLSKEDFIEAYKTAKNNGWKIISAIGHR